MSRVTDPPRVILHLDMDAFYAAVEVREDPSLAGLPLIIGSPGPRGVVSTCSYEARRFGVHSAMPSVTARRLCPQAVWRPGRMSLYVQVSRRIRAILDDAAPLVEPLSIDEAFLDVTGLCLDLQQGAALGRRLKGLIREQEGLSASVGVAPNKFLAKLASDLEKPDGLVLFPAARIPEGLWPLPVDRLWGVGPKTRERLEQLGIRRIGQLLETPRAPLEAAVGPGTAEHLLCLARGEDRRAVKPGRTPRSISEERTYARDLTRAEDVDRALLARSEGVSRDLRRKGLKARTVHIKIRRGDFKTWTRALTLPAPTDLTESIVQAARKLFHLRIDLGGHGVRLLGVGVSGLVPGSIRERLFDPPGEERARGLARATDAIRARFGEEAVTRARLGGGERTDEASSPPSTD